MKKVVSWNWNLKLIPVRNIIQAKDSIPWVRCASGNVYLAEHLQFHSFRTECFYAGFVVFWAPHLHQIIIISNNIIGIISITNIVIIIIIMCMETLQDRVFLFIVCRAQHMYISIIINNININTITMITIVQTSLYSSSNPAVRLTIRTTPTIAAIVTAERRTARWEIISVWKWHCRMLIYEGKGIVWKSRRFFG